MHVGLWHLLAIVIINGSSVPPLVEHLPRVQSVVGLNPTQGSSWVVLGVVVLFSFALLWLHRCYISPCMLHLFTYPSPCHRWRSKRAGTLSVEEAREKGTSQAAASTATATSSQVSLHTTAGGQAWRFTHSYLVTFFAHRHRHLPHAFIFLPLWPFINFRRCQNQSVCEQEVMSMTTRKAL